MNQNAVRIICTFSLLYFLLLNLIPVYLHADIKKSTSEKNEIIKKDKTYIVLLGTGTPNAEPDKHGPSLAIIVNNKPYIIDCGPGLVRRASEAYEAGIKALNLTNLDTLFITHLHSDHTVGLPDLIFTPWVLGRSNPLKIYGPSGTAEMVEHLILAYRQDIMQRLDGLEPANETGYHANPTKFEAGLIFKDENIKVTAFHAKHGNWKNAFGFRFETPEMTVCVSGDTSPYQEMYDNYKDCNVLIHEVYCKKGFDCRTSEWQNYHSKSHTSAVDLGKIASKTNPDVVVLIHQLLWGIPEEDLLAEITANFKGQVIYGKDLMLIYREDKKSQDSDSKYNVIRLIQQEEKIINQ